MMNLKSILWWLPFGSVPEIEATNLHNQLVEGGIQLIDVRSPQEWNNSHIEGSVNVPITSLKTALPNLNLDPNRPVVAICLSAHRSVPAVRLLKHSGFTNSQQLKGGMQAWWKAGLPEVK